ncbi:unnamed protein product [Tetraodon nigroviridis]|uniref:(spotted green pufferfish) hypothetical protein n=1 Tax=Tetraodon nigroviridis TaxID=99883 RepID=Q4SRQ8_TETNG|nr:unnamed protein product [Tetraodon nigroviridis]
MPLEFPDWTWTQSESTVCIQLPLRGAAGTADIVSTERYLKVETRAQVLSRDRKTTLVCAQVHQPPYLFEAFLFQPVDEAAGTARLTDTRVVISLPKKTPGLWTRLRADAGPEERRRLREEALRSHQEALSSGARLRAESKAEDSRYALRAMMELEEEERERIREMKESEREKMEAELSGLEAGGGGRSRKAGTGGGRGAAHVGDRPLRPSVLLTRLQLGAAAGRFLLHEPQDTSGWPSPPGPSPRHCGSHGWPRRRR